MPISNKSSKKTCSKEQLVTVVETQASTSLKSKLNKGNLISNLFGRSKTKNKTNTISDNNQKSLTCLYTNSNASEASSTNVSSINNEVVDGKISKGTLTSLSKDETDEKEIAKRDEKGSKQKSKKGGILDKIRKSVDRTPSTQNEKISCGSVQESKENLTCEKCYASFNECSTLCCISPDVPLIVVLKQVLQFNTRLQESERHLVKIFTNYLKDNDLQKQLIDIVSCHAKLQIQIERRNQALASAMWKQQSDIYKSEEKVLTENLKEIVWQNRKLQEENELLMRRMDCVDGKDMLLCPEKDEIMDRLHQSNERLRNKLSNITQQLHELENHLLNERSRCGTLEEQFAVCFSDLQTEKANVQAIKLDHQLEITNIKQELDSKEEIINNAIKSGDDFLKEMNRIKQEIPSLSDSLNTNNQNVSTNPLVNLIKTSQISLKLVIDKILQLQQEINSITSERDYFKTEASRFQKTLEATSQELVALTKQTDLLNGAMREKEQYLGKINQLEKEKMVLESELNGKDLQLEEAKGEKLLVIQGMHQVKNMVHAKDEELKIVKAENETLVFQNKSLSQILMQSGSGDVARELACSQEKIQVLHSQYYQIVSYKDQLEEKLKLYSNEIELLKTTNLGLNDKVNIQTKTISELNESKLKLKEEISNQQATLTALQNERRRHLAEKNFLRSIYDKIEQSASKTECLEGSLSEISKEADRLAIIADFNKQLGDRYQTEIQEKDEIISELKETIKKLNAAQQVNVKEKVALCEELTEMCSIKEILANKLQMEVQKSFYITESAKETESSVSEELKVLKEMQKVERSAVKELLEDFNILVTQRDNLLKFKAEAQSQLERLQRQVSDYQEEFNKRGKDLIEKQQAIVWLDKQLRSSDEKSKSFTNSVENALKKQLCNMEHLVEENSKLVADKNKYKTSIDYLKSNIHNLQTSLDQSRKNEYEYKKLFEVETEKTKMLSEELKEINGKNLTTTEEVVTLRERLAQLQKDYNHLYSNHQELLTEIPEQPGLLENYKKAQGLLEEYQLEIGCLKNTISSQTIKIESLQKNQIKLEDIIEELTIEGKKLNKNLLEAVSENDLIHNKLKLSENELEKIKNELSDKVKLLDEKTKNEKHLENSFLNAQTHINDLMTTLQNTDEKNIKLKSKLEVAQNIYKALEDTHRKLAEKLLKTVHTLMNEKVSRRTAETNCEQLTEKIAKVEAEKNDLIQKIKSQNDAIKNHEKKCSDIEVNKVELEERLTESVNNYKEILSRYDELIRDFAAVEMKCKDYESRLKDYLSDCPKCRDLEERMNDLQCNLESSHENIVNLHDTVKTLTLNINSLELEKSETELHSHELEKQLEVERSLREKTQETNHKILTKLLELTKETKISESVCDILLSVVRTSA